MHASHMLPVQQRAVGRHPFLDHCRIVAMICLFLASGCSMNHTTTTTGFSSDDWKSQRGVSSDGNRRLAQLADLKPLMREGMARQEVLDLLGEPDRSDPDTGVDAYALGVSPFGIDAEYYEIRYHQGRLVSHQLTRD